MIATTNIARNPVSYQVAEASCVGAQILRDKCNHQHRPGNQAPTRSGRKFVGAQILRDKQHPLKSRPTGGRLLASR